MQIRVVFLGNERRNEEARRKKGAGTGGAGNGNGGIDEEDREKDKETEGEKGGESEPDKIETHMDGSPLNLVIPPSTSTPTFDTGIPSSLIVSDTVLGGCLSLRMMISSEQLPPTQASARTEQSSSVVPSKDVPWLSNASYVTSSLSLHAK